MGSTLVISDIHLASEVSKAKTLRKFLQQKANDFERVVILGDLFDHANFNRLKGKHWDVLDELRHISKRAEVVWVEGNHDVHVFTEVISHMIGAKIVGQKDHYEIKTGGKKFILIHGHQFDTFISDFRWRLFAVSASKIYSWIQRIDTKDYTLSRFIKKKSKILLKVSKANRDTAWEYASKHDAQVIVCGHTHQAMKEVSKDGIIYINSGSWVDSPCNYIIIKENGEVDHFEYGASKEGEM